MASPSKEELLLMVNTLKQVVDEHKQQVDALAKQLSVLRTSLRDSKVVQSSASAVPIKERRVFLCNGPIHDSFLYGKVTFVLAHEKENLMRLMDAVRLGLIVQMHGPRQSGKTTRCFALQNRLKEAGITVDYLSLESFCLQPIDKMKEAIVLNIHRVRARRDSSRPFLIFSMQAGEPSVLLP